MIALDTNALSLLLIPGATVSWAGSSTPIKFAKERLGGVGFTNRA